MTVRPVETGNYPKEDLLLFIQKEGEVMVFKKKVVSFGSLIVMMKAMTKAMTKAVAASWYNKADCACRG
jgi:hypothetical protein